MPSYCGQSPLRVDGEELLLLRALVGEEEMRLVLDDRPADGAAVLIRAGSPAWSSGRIPSR